MPVAIDGCDDLDIFNTLGLDPHASPITGLPMLLTEHRRTVTRHLHPDRLVGFGFEPPAGTDIGRLNGLIDKMKGLGADDLANIIRQINRRGKKDWISTWDRGNEMGSWSPMPSWTQRNAAPAAPSSAAPPLSAQPATAPPSSAPSSTAPTNAPTSRPRDAPSKPSYYT